MKTINTNKTPVPAMKKFAIREAETLKTTAAAYYGICSCLPIGN
ncbi:MAG TPA: hypothetical protein VK184_14145 [Nostocaceae cyanobacterium]|nr:hypothetical protein [Nostocaceae cyanobacterium]